MIYLVRCTKRWKVQSGHVHTQLKPMAELKRDIARTGDKVTKPEPEECWGHVPLCHRYSQRLAFASSAKRGR